MHLVSRILLVPVAAAGLVTAAGAEDWIDQSNRHTQVLLEAQARFIPEAAGQLGVDGLDEDVIDLRPGFVERGNAATAEALVELERRLETAKHPLVRQDLEILIDAGRDGIRGGELNERYLLPYFNPSQNIFQGVRALLDPQIPAERHPAAVTRLRRYAGLEDGYVPITELARDRISERFDAEGLLGPYRAQVGQDLANSPRFIAGIRGLLEQYELAGYEEAMAALEQQVEEYNEWIRAEVLPRARADHRLPEELYAFNLDQFGVDISPRELIQRAKIAFVEIRNEMHALAPLVARERGLELTDYRDVIRELRKDQLVGEEILPFYRQTISELEQITARERVVSLPEREAAVRLASEAESAQIPAPHLRPPRLVGNTGEYSEFVLPLNIPSPEGTEELKLDDFTHRSAAWTLSVHEARPGHELQFSQMLETGVSTARVVYAFNSVNVEGWALYAEAEMKPYLPLDGQLISLQHRMMRAARAFLDPMVNLGEITPEGVQSFLEEEVVLSRGAASSERERYTFRAPGQATSYFYGYTRLMELRAKAELALGEKFDRKAYHDFVLAQGLLPPQLLHRAVMEQFVGAISRSPSSPAGAAPSHR